MKNKIFSFSLIIIIGVTLLLPGFSNFLAAQTEIPPSLILLGAGAKWAARADSELIALYVNWQDSLYLNPNPLGTPYTLPNPGDSISYILEEYGFKVEFAGDLPNELSPYSVVVIAAYWAIEPKHEPIIRDYVSKGGGVVIISGAPCYFICYSKDSWPYRCGGNNLASIRDWFGANYYLNTGGNAKLVIENPFGTYFKKGDIITKGAGFSSAAVRKLEPGAEIIAEWGDGNIFAFKYEKIGRVYYQADYEEYKKPIIGMTIPELQTEIIKVKTEIRKLMEQLIQILKEEIAELRIKLIEFKAETEAR